MTRQGPEPEHRHLGFSQVRPFAQYIIILPFDHSKNFREQNPFPLRRMMSADDVAAKVLRAAAHRRREIVLTTDGKLLWWLKKFSPRLVDRILLQYVKARPAASPA